MIILLQQAVLSRILKLYKTVLAIGNNKDIKARVSVSGKDEIGSLSKAINALFDSLNQAMVGEQESKERFKNIADTAPIFIWLAGADKNCTYINKSWLDFTGRSLAQELGDGWQENIHADDREEFLKGYAAVFENRSVYKKEIRLRKADGTYSWVTVQIVPNITKEGNLAGCLCVASDITDLKQSTNQIERVNKLLEGREVTLSALQQENERLKSEIKDKKI
jgi:PAS domain S-box-containing protein